MLRPLPPSINTLVRRDNGVDDERVVTRSGNMGGIVPLIKSDRRFQPAKEGRDGRFGDACLSIAHFVLALRVDGIRSIEDHDAFLEIRKAVLILAHHASFLGYCLLALSFFWPVGLSQKALRSLQSL